MRMHGDTKHVEGPPGRSLPDCFDGTVGQAEGAVAGAGDPDVTGGSGRAELEGTLAELVDRLSVALERSNVLDYTILLQHPWRMVWINFVGGAARGLGIGIGFTVLTAILLYILRGLMLANLPVIGDLIATIVRLVEQQLRP